MDNSFSYMSALMIGLLGSAHCIGMCGGIVNALGFALSNNLQKASRPSYIVFLYNMGRILSYAVAGAMVGLFGWLVQDMGNLFGLALRLLAGLMLIAMGLYIAGWWRVLVHLENIGGRLWRYLQPIGNKLVPVKHRWQALLLGIIWGWLPCGLVYSALTLAVTMASWQQSAFMMLMFGAGTLPALLISGSLSVRFKYWLQQSVVRGGVGLVLISFGVWTVILPIYHSFPGNSSGHEQNYHQGQYEKIK